MKRASVLRKTHQCERYLKDHQHLTNVFKFRQIWSHFGYNALLWKNTFLRTYLPRDLFLKV